MNNSTTLLAPAAELISEGGREGRVSSSDNRFSLDFTAPDAATPEHLFAAAYAACFHSSLLSAAGRKITGSSVLVKIGLREEPGDKSEFVVEIRVGLPGVDKTEAQKLLSQAHASCPYSRALRGGATVHVSID